MKFSHVNVIVMNLSLRPIVVAVYISLSFVLCFQILFLIKHFFPIVFYKKVHYQAKQFLIFYLFISFLLY